MHLSIVIPAYNEAERIGETLRAADAYLAAQPYDAEVVVVDDGSGDGTAGVVEACAAAAKVPVTLASLPRNRGKGFAVRTGMREHARGSYRVYYDADGSTPIAELAKLWPAFDAGADIVIGSRALPASDVQVRQAWYRQTMGRIFNLILRALALSPYKDTQCGFKGFTQAACETVFPRQTLDRFSFDAELLYIAARHGLRIAEVPVVWRNSPLSRVNPLRDAARMFLDLLRIRANVFLGKYR